MGLWNRIGDLLDANLTAILDHAEDPEATLAQAIRAMEDTLTEVRSGTVRLMAERSELSARWREIEFEMLEWDRRAELALTHQREDLARAALAARENVRRNAGTLKQDLDGLDGHIARLAEDAQKLQVKLADAVSRRRALANRYRSAVDRLQVRSQLYDGRVDAAMARCTDLDREIDTLEARAEVAGMGRPRSLADEIDALNRDNRIDADLEALKARLAAR
jgi:phage shock protein A